MLNMKQSDCRFGGMGFAAGEDLSLKVGCLVKLNSGGDLVLPTSAADITPYVVICGADTGYLCVAVPLTSAGNCRIKLSGTCEAGDLLVSKGDGRVEKGVLGGTALPIGLAEEAGIDGQFVLARPLCVGVKGEDGAAGAAGADGTDAGVLLIPRDLVAGGGTLGVGDIGRVLFFGETSFEYVWNVTPPSTPLFAAVILGASSDTIPVLTLKIVIRGNFSGSLVTVPAALVVGDPLYDGWIDVYDSGGGVYKLGVAFSGVVGSTAVRVRSTAGSVYMGYSEIVV